MCDNVWVKNRQDLEDLMGNDDDNFNTPKSSE